MGQSGKLLEKKERSRSQCESCQGAWEGVVGVNGQSGCWDRVRSRVSRVGSAVGRIAVNGAERRTVRRQVAKRAGAIASVKRKSVGCRGTDCWSWGAKGALVSSRDLWS